MRTNFAHLAVVLIVGLCIGASLNKAQLALPVALGAMLVLVLWLAPSIWSFIRGLYSPAPRQAVHKPAPLVYLYDPETQRLEGISRELAMQLLEARRRIG